VPRLIRLAATALAAAKLALALARPK